MRYIDITMDITMNITMGITMETYHRLWDTYICQILAIVDVSRDCIDLIGQT